MTIYVINPNSSAAATRGISKAIANEGLAEPEVVCLTTSEGPPGIESDRHVEDAAKRLPSQIAALESPTAVVVACFSDPGVSDTAPTVRFPVVGIREAAISKALNLGHRFGVIAMGDASIPRHMAAFEELGVMDRLAGDRAVGLSMADYEDRSLALPRLLKVARQLKELDNADVLILGCAGMPMYKDEIEAAVGLPVVEPCAAGVAVSIERLTSISETCTET